MHAHGPGGMTPAGRRRGARGAVTAELALGLPLLLSVTLGLVWMLAAGVAQVRAVDAARETARAVARGEETSTAVALGRRIAPAGATVEASVVGGQVLVVTAAPVEGPGGLFSALPTITVEAEALAVVEEQW